MNKQWIVVSFLLIIEIALSSYAIMRDFTRDSPDRNDWWLPYKFEQTSEEKFREYANFTTNRDICLLFVEIPMFYNFFC